MHPIKLEKAVKAVMQTQRLW